VKRIIILALGVLLALALATPMALAQVGQGAKASGKAAELAAAWTQWAYSKPVENSPLIGDYSGGEQCDGTPVSPTQGKTWFLAGSQDGSAVERTCTMPVGTHLFFPVVSCVAFPFSPTETEENQRQACIDFIDAVVNDPEFSMLVTVDGKEVKSNRIVRALSPVFTLTLPEENVFDPFVPPPGVPAGEYDSASADGLWVTLPPLPPGEHTIHFEMSAPNFGETGFSQDNTYYLTVTTPSGKAPATTPATAAATAPAVTTPPATATTPAATTPPAAPQPLP
jgi:hypothetical protein